jgi:hypothetical protein
MTGVTHYLCQSSISNWRCQWCWLWRYQAQVVLLRMSLGPRCLAPMCPGAQPRAVRPQLPDPRAPCTGSCLDCICLVLLTLHPRPSIEGGWREKLTWCARRLPVWSDCSTRHWPRSTLTFFAQSRSVWERKMKKPFPYP